MALRALWLIPVLGLHAFAAEYAVLSTGYRLRVERHEQAGENVRLYYEGGGLAELPATHVTGFEPDDRPAAPILAAVPAAPAPALSPAALVKQAALGLGESDFVALVQSVAKNESAYRVDALSPKGAIGLMQLMPGTARELGVNATDPGQNARGGARYLRDLLLKYRDHPYQVRLAVAAYNAGPAAVDRYQGVPPYRETVEYVRRVLRDWEKSRKMRQNQP